jgi:membrane-associated phospholipid phosphatase
VEEAVARGEAIARFERAIGAFVVPEAHRWLVASPLRPIADAVYLGAHVPALVGALVVAWHLRPALYERTRNVFLGAHALTVAAYVVVPTAPPRLVPSLVLHDPLAALPGEAAGVAHHLQHAYAAFPSGHVVFALVAGTTFSRLAPNRPLSLVALCYPALVAAIVVATGHHYGLDVLGGFAVWCTASGLESCRSALAGRRAGLQRGWDPAGVVLLPHPAVVVRVPAETSSRPRHATTVLDLGPGRWEAGGLDPAAR